MSLGNIVWLGFSSVDPAFVWLVILYLVNIFRKVFFWCGTHLALRQVYRATGHNYGPTPSKHIFLPHSNFMMIFYLFLPKNEKRLSFSTTILHNIVLNRVEIVQPSLCNTSTPSYNCVKFQANLLMFKEPVNFGETQSYTIWAKILSTCVQAYVRICESWWLTLLSDSREKYRCSDYEEKDWCRQIIFITCIL